MTPTEAIEYLETHHLDLIRAETRESNGTFTNYWLVTFGATEVAEGETILEAVANAKREMEKRP